MPDSAALEIQAILESLSLSPTIFGGFMRGLPAEALARKRGKGVWSIHEHATHLADVQPMITERLRRILAEDVPEFVPFIPSEEESAQGAEPEAVQDILAAFKAERERQVEMLRQARAEDWDRSAVHPEYERYGLLILVRHILMHDHWHLYRMEELWLTRDAFLTRLEG